MKYFCFLLVLALTLFGCNKKVIQPADNSLTEQITGITPEQIEIAYEQCKMFPENTEVSVAVINSGSTLFFGLKRVNNEIRNVENRNRIFEIGSISKVFTSTLLADFVVENRVDLNDPIQKYLSVQLPTDEQITLVQLANHTSGLPRLPSNLNLLFAGKENPYKNYDEEKLKEYLTEKIKLRNKPGEKSDYSNLGAGILGYLLTGISDSTYDELCRVHIFSKYGMNLTTANRANLKGELVKGRDKNGDETSNWDLNVLAGAGGILSNVEDLSRFVHAHFNIENKELALTRTPTFKVSETLHMGLGLHIIKTKTGKTWYWHNGGTGGYSSSMIFDTDNKYGVLVLSNLSAFSKLNGNIDKLCTELMKSLEEE